MKRNLQSFWTVPVPELLEALQTTTEGLGEEEVERRLKQYGANLLKPRKRTDTLTLLLGQFKSPIILILLFAAALSLFLQDSADAVIILIIVLVSGLLGFWQERGAVHAVEKLLDMVQIKATAIRGGYLREIHVEGIVPGDIVTLGAGDVIPGDCLILESKDLFVDEAALTGETFPVEKAKSILAPGTPLSQRTNVLFMGTHVVSGSGKAVVVYTGRETEFGKVSERLELRPPETEFEKGVKRFGYLLMEVTLILVIAIFAINAYFKRPVLESFLFALALAVGLTPQLLPAIISINLAHGARRMATKKVIVKRLASIENFGSMDVLCSDKTGTLTQGVIQLDSALDVGGQESEKVLFWAYLNAFFESGFVNPIDEAIRNHRAFDVGLYRKVDEVPYDFIRKRLSILVSKEDRHLIVTKGAFLNVLAVCSHAEISREGTVGIDRIEKQIRNRFQDLSQKGFRVLGVAFRDLGAVASITKESETDMTFLGFLIFSDPPKPGIMETIRDLKQMGISLKIITGDNALVSAHVSHQVGLSDPRILTGQNLRQMSDEAFSQQITTVDIFAEVEPNQKEHIILDLKKMGHVVGFMGDGINDASALHAADVSISVDSAVDVAKEASDIVLLEKDLSVLIEGVREGRMTFANTLKYVFMATSANFGNMFSMAGASLFLPFLPLLPKQILLTNLLTDFPEMTIATDRVDEEWVEKPRCWNIRFIRNFMLTFGTLSSVFDYLTFGVLLFLLKATTNQFRTGWFMESVVSASVIVLVIRTRRPFFKSRPGRYLLIATLLIVAVTLILPFTPLGRLFGFTRLSILFFLFVGGIVLFYIVGAELAKAAFYKKARF